LNVDSIYIKGGVRAEREVEKKRGGD